MTEQLTNNNRGVVFSEADNMDPPWSLSTTSYTAFNSQPASNTSAFAHMSSTQLGAPASAMMGSSINSTQPIFNKSRRMTTWARIKKSQNQAAKEPKSILDVLTSTKSLAAEAREERLEEMEEAHELRNCSMSNVLNTFHPARSSKVSLMRNSSSNNSAKFRDAMRAGTGEPEEERVQTNVTLLQLSSEREQDVIVPIREIPTFNLRDKIFFVFSGIPNALRSTIELRSWIFPSDCISNFTLLVVTFSCLSFCIESLPQYFQRQSSPAFLQVTTYFSMVWLTFELIMRLIFSQDRSAMLKLPFTWVDIISNIPYYIELFSGQRAARILILIRLLRLTRILRVFDLSKHNVGMQSVWGSVVKSANGLTLFILLLTVIMFVGSAIIYIAEMSEASFNRAVGEIMYDNTDRPSPFQSMLHTLWFVIATITTTGYGDDVPITPAGYTMASILMLIGPFVIAFPTVILSSNFQETHRELLEQVDRTRLDRSNDIEESRQINARKNAEFASVMRHYVPKSVQDEMQRRHDLVDNIMSHTDITYTMAIGAPPRSVIIRHKVALYNPLLMLRCAYPDGEPEYGFQSSTGVSVTVRDNFPEGSIVRFQLLLHTVFTQEAALMAVHQYMKHHPLVDVETVAPRPIKVLRVSMKSKHALLGHMHLTCTKFKDPFGTIPLEVVLTKPEALPVLLRYASSCSFHFSCEFHDSTSMSTTTMLGLSEHAQVDYHGRDSAIAKLLTTAFPTTTSQGNESDKQSAGKHSEK